MDVVLASGPIAITPREAQAEPLTVGIPVFATGLLSGRRILVVEDEMLILMDAEDMLADLGCERVVGAATIEAALALIKQAPFDAALVDLNLNGDRSYAIADALAAAGVPFAYATGYGLHGLRPVDSGRPMLMKPYRDDDLAQTMGALCGS